MSAWGFTAPSRSAAFQVGYVRSWIVKASHPVVTIARARNWTFEPEPLVAVVAVLAIKE